MQSFIQKVGGSVFSNEPLSYVTRQWLVVALLAIAIILGLQDYRVDGWLFDKDVSLRPDLMSGLLAIGFAGAIYYRRLMAFHNRIYCIILFTLVVTVTAILMQALLGNTASFFSRLPMPYIVAFSLFSTLTGLPQVALLSWFATVFLALVNLGSASDALGMNGFFFILCVGGAVLLQVADRLQLWTNVDPSLDRSGQQNFFVKNSKVVPSKKWAN